MNVHLFIQPDEVIYLYGIYYEEKTLMMLKGYVKTLLITAKYFTTSRL